MTDYLDEILFKNQILYMLYYDRIVVSERIDFAKGNKSKEFMICHYFIFNHGINGYHDLIM